MTVTPTFTTIIDVAEPRVKQNSSAVRSDGRYWDILNSTAYIDPITRTAMLMPLYKTGQWLTSPCGRLGKSDFSIAGNKNWVEHQWTSPYEKWIKGLSINDGVTTLASWPIDQAFYLGWFAFGSGTDDFEVMQCGWSDGSLPYNPGTASNPDIRLRFYSSGKCEIFKNGNFVGTGNIFERKVTSQNTYGTQTTSSRADNKQIAGQAIEVLLIPCRRRELLVVSNMGGGFSFIFEDIDPNDPAPVITGAGPFFWYVPYGAPQVQLAPLQTLTSGYALSLPNGYLDAPQTGQTPQTLAFWDGPAGASVAVSVVKPDNSGAFVANGSNTLCRLRVDLSGDGNVSPWVYGADAVFPSVQANTDGAHSTVLDSYIKSATLTVPESPTDVTLALTLHSPQDIETAGASKIRVVGNRAVVAKIGSIAFLTGRTKAPVWTDAINDRARNLALEARDRAFSMEQHRIKSPVPIDGANLSDALAYFAQMPGYSTGDMDIQAIDYALPISGQASEGEYALLPDPLDTALQWVQRLHQTFAANYEWGWVPRATGPKFRFHDLDYLNAQAVAATLYSTSRAALDALVPREKLPANVYRSYRETNIFVEANDIWVIGREPRTGKPLRTHYADYASQDPTLAPSARPDNWVGCIWYASLLDNALTTLRDGARACIQLAKRLTPGRVLGEWESDFLLWPNGQPVWRGDLVKLKGKGTFRVISLSGDFKSEYANQGNTDPWPDQIWRPFTYVGERVSVDTTPDLTEAQQGAPAM